MQWPDHPGGRWRRTRLDRIGPLSGVSSAYDVPRNLKQKAHTFVAGSPSSRPSAPWVPNAYDQHWRRRCIRRCEAPRRVGRVRASEVNAPPEVGVPDGRSRILGRSNSRSPSRRSCHRDQSAYQRRSVAPSPRRPSRSHPRLEDAHELPRCVAPLPVACRISLALDAVASLDARKKVTKPR